MVLARRAASCEPSSLHCSKLELSASFDVWNAVSKFARVWAVPRKCWPGPFSLMASRAWPFSERSMPFANVANMPTWSSSRMNFS